MSGYTKLFSSIVHSTIWQESKETKLVWVTLLALADRDGSVGASIPGLAKAAGVSVEECEAALAVLLAPDPYSRSKTEDGRRIREIDGGWELVNHATYRERSSPEEVREKAAERKRRQRARENDGDLGYGGSPCHAESHESQQVTSTHDKAEAEAEEEERSSTSGLKVVEPPTSEGDSLSATADAPKPDRDPRKDPDVVKVFEYWRKDTGRERSKLDSKRARRIKARLREGFTPRDLAVAIRNRRLDPWLSGADPKSPGYDGIETLLRDAAQVERLRDLRPSPSGGRAKQVVVEDPTKRESEENIRKYNLDGAGDEA